jgi:hypothetical protein
VRRKMIFELTQDEDGYPPVAAEGIWVEQVDTDLYRLDNIPFYSYGVSFEDVVHGTVNELGELVFVRLHQPSKRSTFRVIVHDQTQVESVRKEIETFGCATEVNKKQQLIAVDVPEEANIRLLLQYLMKSRDNQVCDFEEGVLRRSV